MKLYNRDIPNCLFFGKFIFILIACGVKFNIIFLAIFILNNWVLKFDYLEYVNLEKKIIFSLIFADQITHIEGIQVAPAGCPVLNPSFDITPFKYLTGIITEEGICYPPYGISTVVTTLNYC